jgi:hypothetical protein
MVWRWRRLNAALDSKVIASRLGVPDMQIPHSIVAEEVGNHRFNRPVLDILLGKQAPATPVGHEGKAMAAEILRKSLAGESLARLRMNEHWPRQWERFKAMEGIVGEQNPVFFADLEGA